MTLKWSTVSLLYIDTTRDTNHPTYPIGSPNCAKHYSNLAVKDTNQKALKSHQVLSCHPMQTLADTGIAAFRAIHKFMLTK